MCYVTWENCLVISGITLISIVDEFTHCLFFSFFCVGPKTHSRLIVSDVIKEDSGNYTCSAPNTLSSSIDVFVSPGKT